MSLNPDDPQAHRALGLALPEKRDWVGAIGEYREALHRHSADAELEQKLGEALYARGDLTGAVSALRAAASLEPDDAKVRNMLGLGLYGLEDMDGAVAACSEAVRLDPKYTEAYNNLGDALLKKGDRRRPPRGLPPRFRTGAQQFHVGDKLRGHSEATEAIIAAR